MKQTSIALEAALAAIISLSAKADSARPVAVELFISQGCHSCPPAEQYLSKLAKRPEFVALEWHSNY
jgi:hypothetical protein